MRQRQKSEVRIDGRQVLVEQMPDGTDGGDNVLVCQHDALWGTGGARGVHDAKDVVRVGWDRFLWLVRPESFDLINVDDLKAFPLRPQLCQDLVGGFTVVYDEPDRGTRLDDFGQRRQELGVGEHASYVWLLERMGEPLRAERVVGGADCYCGKGTGVGHDLPVDAVHRLASLQRIGEKSWTHAVDA